MKVGCYPLRLLMFLSTALVSCSSKEMSKDTDTIFFSVDETLLGENYVDSVDAFSLGIPKGLKPSDLAILLEGQPLRVQDSILAFFMDSAKTATLAVRVLPFDSLKVAKILEKADSALNSQKIWTSVSANSYNWNRLQIHQVMSQNADVVNFRLFLKPAARYVEVNFTIQRIVYPQYLKKVESTFGSLRKI